MKCSTRFCGKTAIEYEKKTDSYLCPECVGIRNLVQNVGYWGAIKESIKKGWNEEKEKDGWY